MTHDTPTDTTTTDSEDSTASADDASMGSVDHTHPERNTTFGSVFGRGPSVAADGGEPAAGEPAAETDEVMEDVDHEAPSDSGANATFERGAEHADAADAEGVPTTDEARDE